MNHSSHPWYTWPYHAVPLLIALIISFLSDLRRGRHAPRCDRCCWFEAMADHPTRGWCRRSEPPRSVERRGRCEHFGRLQRIGKGRRR